MKKLFLVLLCAGLLAACGNKNKQNEVTVDTVATEEVTETPVEQPAVAEVKTVAPEQTTQTAPAETEKQTVKEHAVEAAESIANTAIDKVTEEAADAAKNTPVPHKKRR